MTPSARVQAACEILDDILDGVPAEKALTGWSRRSRYAGSKDRAAVRDHVFDALRQRNSAAHLGGELTGRGLMIGLTRLQDIALDTLFSGMAYGADALSTEEEASLPNIDEGQSHIDMQEWLLPALKSSLGAEYDGYLEGLRSRAPISLRVNIAQSDRETVQTLLAEAGIETRGVPLAKTALSVVEGARKVKLSEPYLSGLVELQDASCQAVIAELPLREGMKVLDYCAGGGGKSLAMAAYQTAEYWVHDTNPQRMVDIPMRAERASVQLHATTSPSDDAPFDLVFCDVPCSGSGTWRRAPNAKWVFTPDMLEDLLAVQAEILSTAQGLVGPGGYLVYATCSVLAQENVDQIDRFCEQNPEWAVSWTRQYPMSNDGDGFYGAVLQRS